MYIISLIRFLKLILSFSNSINIIKVSIGITIILKQLKKLLLNNKYVSESKQIGISHNLAFLFFVLSLSKYTVVNTSGITKIGIDKPKFFAKNNITKYILKINEIINTLNITNYLPICLDYIVHLGKCQHHYPRILINHLPLQN